MFSAISTEPLFTTESICETEMDRGKIASELQSKESAPPPSRLAPNANLQSQFFNIVYVLIIISLLKLLRYTGIQRSHSGRPTGLSS